MNYDYIGTLLYSAKNRKNRNDGKLKYYICRDFDGKNIIVERINNPPSSMALSKKGKDQYQWYIHNLDILSEKYNVCILVNQAINKEDNNES